MSAERVEVIQPGMPQGKIDRQRQLVIDVSDMVDARALELDDWIAVGVSILATAIARAPKRLWGSMLDGVRVQMQEALSASDLADRMDRSGGSAR